MDLNGGNSFRHLRQRSQLARIDTYEPKAPARDIVDELLRANERPKPLCCAGLLCEEIVALVLRKQQVPSVIGMLPKIISGTRQTGVRRD